MGKVTRVRVFPHGREAALRAIPDGFARVGGKDRRSRASRENVVGAVVADLHREAPCR